METRIQLRKLTMDDLDNIFALYHDENVAKYMRYGIHKDIDETRKLLGTYLDPSNYAYVLINKENQDFIGYLSLCLASQEKQSYSFTIITREKYWGGGYSSEATKLLIELAKELPIKEVLAYVYQENIGSCKVVEKCGFTHAFTIDEESKQPVLVYRYQIDSE